MHLHRLHGRKTAAFLLRKGNVWKGKTMIVRWLPGAPRIKGRPPLPPGLYVGTFASAKLHKSAVKRNRMRRRIREAWRIHVKDIDDLPTAQLLISPRIASLDAPFPDIRADVRSFLSLSIHG
jgi:RNase P protein component